jgi:hypothetical protein
VFPHRKKPPTKELGRSLTSDYCCCCSVLRAQCSLLARSGYGLQVVRCLSELQALGVTGGLRTDLPDRVLRTSRAKTSFSHNPQAPTLAQRTPYPPRLRLQPTTDQLVPGHPSRHRHRTTDHLHPSIAQAHTLSHNSLFCSQPVILLPSPPTSTFCFLTCQQHSIHARLNRILHCTAPRRTAPVLLSLPPSSSLPSSDSSTWR